MSHTNSASAIPRPRATATANKLHGIAASGARGSTRGAGGRAGPLGLKSPDTPRLVVRRPTRGTATGAPGMQLNPLTISGNLK